MSIQRQETGMLVLYAHILVWMSEKAPEHLIWQFFSKYQILMLLELLIKIRSPKGLVTPRDHGFFSSKNHVIEEILNFFLANIYYFE